MTSLLLCGKSSPPFTSHKNNMKKTWKTIDETLNRGKSKTQFPNEFTIDNKSITDHKEIADQFNIFFCKYWC